MIHRKWRVEDACRNSRYDLMEEHNALYDAWADAEKKATEAYAAQIRPAGGDTLAARLREAFLGTETGEAVPFDNLKDHVRDRWQRVADVAREVPPKGIALAAARERGHRAAMRVPFSDAQIERMAKAARDSREYTGNSWSDIIRAALAAGGLEPCAVPEYDPADVALRPSDDVWKTDFVAGWLTLHACGKVIVADNTKAPSSLGSVPPADAARMAAWLSSYAAAHGAGTPTGHVLRDSLAKIERQRKNLNQLYTANAALRDDITNAVRNAMDRLPDAPWKDKTATEAVWLLSLAVSGAEANATDLRDQLAAADLDLADKAFYVREFAAVSAERDRLQKRNDVQADQLRRIDSEISPLMAQIAALRERAEQAEAERDDLQYENPIIRELRAILGLAWGESITERCKELAAMTERASVPVKVRFQTAPDELCAIWKESSGSDDLISRMTNYLAAHAVIDAPASVDPPADQVEALARVLHKSQDAFYCRYGDHATKFDDHTPLWSTMARAAIAHLSTRPEGLPTMRDLREIGVHAYLSHDSAKRENAGCMVDPMGAAADAILTALRPWLRDPVGWELDVTADVIEVIARSSSRQTRAKEIIDLCRLRIRPVYECKECDQWRKDWDTQSKAYEMLSNAYNAASKQLNAARAALEGE